jgi:hypothetical protein
MAIYPRFIGDGVERLISLADADVLLFGAHYQSGTKEDSQRKLILIGRARGRISQVSGEGG